MLQAQVANRKKADRDVNKPSKPGQVAKSPDLSAAVASSSKPIQARFIGAPQSRATSHSSSAASASSSSEDEGGEEGGLKSLAKLQKSPEKLKRQAERRQIKLIDDPMTNERNAMQRKLEALEASRRQTMRLAPDITPLLRSILSWDYDHEGTDVPYRGQRPQLQKVLDRFSNHPEYRRVFEPLLMLECWTQIVQSKEEKQPETYECKIAGRQFVDDWLDLEAVITVPVRREWRITENDIVLLRNAGIKKCIMAKGAGFKPTLTGVQVSLRCCLGIGGDPGLNLNSVWSIHNVFRCVLLQICAIFSNEVV
jgi:senataxin